jgi:hypothetical protein
MKMGNPLQRRARTVLRTPIDPTRDWDQQIAERWQAAYHFFGVTRDNPIALLSELMVAQFPKAFQFKVVTKPIGRKSRMGTRSIDDSRPLRAFVDALIEGKASGLPSSSQRKLASDILRNLGGRRPTVNGVCDLIARLTRVDWNGKTASTLRDAYTRPRGGAPGKALRTRRAFSQDLLRAHRLYSTDLLATLQNKEEDGSI